MKGYKILSEKEHGGLKTMLDVLEIGIVAKATGRGYSTLKRIKDSTSFADFKRLTKEAYTPYLHKYDQPDVSKTATEASLTPELHNEATILGILERIATSLEKLETHWRPEKKKGLFS